MIVMKECNETVNVESYLLQEEVFDFKRSLECAEAMRETRVPDVSSADTGLRGRPITARDRFVILR